MKRHHQLSFGAELIDGGVRFRLWAPKLAAVTVLLEDAPTKELRLQPEGDGWHMLTTDAAGPGTRYRYRVGDLVVPDPASRFQPDDIAGPSEVIDPGAYNWTDQRWTGRPWEEIVIYELHTGTFSPSGDFDGIRTRLDHLAMLGVTAVELMPVADFPGRFNWGYDGVLPFAPDSRYGRPEDLKRLVDACHARGLCLFLDVVYNHFGPEGNYLPRYAPEFFTERHKTPWGAALNFDGARNRPVRDFFIENALYWLEEFHVDGLRLDAVHAILDDSTPDLLTELAGRVRGTIANRHVHLVLENNKNQARHLARADGAARLYTAQWNDDVHHALRVLTSGETGGYYEDYADRPRAHLGRALAEGFGYQGERSRHLGVDRGEPSAHLPPTAFVAFIQNHDQVGNHAFGSRLTKLAPLEAVRMAAAICLLCPQTPLLFMGEEWASDQPFPFFCDFGPALAEAVRKGRCEEFGRFPEFQDPESLKRIPDPCAATTRDSARLDWDALSHPNHAETLAFYKRLLALRQREIVPRLKGLGGNSGSYEIFGGGALAVQWRLGDGSALSVIANFADVPVHLDSLNVAAPEGEVIFAVPEGAATISDGALAPRSAVFRLRRAVAA